MSTYKTASKGNNLLQLYVGNYNSSTGVSYAASGLCITIDKIVDSSLEGLPGTGAMKLVCTTKQYNEDLDNFLNYFSTSNTDEDEKITYEDKTTETFSSTLPVTKTFGAAFVGGTITKVPLTYGRAKLSGATGNIKYSSKTPDTTFEISFISGVTQSWAADCFTGTAMDALFTAPGAKTITASEIGQRVWAASK